MSVRSAALAALLAAAGAVGAAAQAPSPSLVWDTVGRRIYFAVPARAPGPPWFGWSWAEPDSLSAGLFEAGGQQSLDSLEPAGAVQTAEALGFPAVSVGPQGELWLLRPEATPWLDLLDAAEAAFRRGGSQMPVTQLLGVNEVGRIGPCRIFSTLPLGELQGEMGRFRLRAGISGRPAGGDPLSRASREIEIVLARYSRWSVAGDSVCIPESGQTLRLFPTRANDSTSYFLNVSNVRVERADPASGPQPNWMPGVRDAPKQLKPLSFEADSAVGEGGWADLCRAERLRPFCERDRKWRARLYTAPDSLGNRGAMLSAAIGGACRALLNEDLPCQSGRVRWAREPRLRTHSPFFYTGGIELLPGGLVRSLYGPGDNVRWMIARRELDSIAAGNHELRLVAWGETMTVRPGDSGGSRDLLAWGRGIAVVVVVVVVAFGSMRFLKSRRHGANGPADLRSRLFRTLRIEPVAAAASRLNRRAGRHPLEAVAFGSGVRDPGLSGSRTRASGRDLLRAVRLGGKNGSIQPDGRVAAHFDRALDPVDPPGDVPTEHRWAGSPAFLTFGGAWLVGNTGEPALQELRGAPLDGAQAALARWRKIPQDQRTRLAACIALGAALDAYGARVGGATLPEAVVRGRFLEAEEKKFFEQLRERAGSWQGAGAWFALGRALLARPGGSAGGDEAGDRGEPGDSGATAELQRSAERAPWLAVLLGLWWEGADGPARDADVELRSLVRALRQEVPLALPDVPSGWKPLSDPSFGILLGWWLAGAGVSRPDGAGGEGEDDSPQDSESFPGPAGGGGEARLTQEQFGRMLERQVREAAAAGADGRPDWVRTLRGLVVADGGVGAAGGEAESDAAEKLRAREEATWSLVSECYRLLDSFNKEAETARQELKRYSESLPAEVTAIVREQAGEVVKGWKSDAVSSVQAEAGRVVRSEWEPLWAQAQEMLPLMQDPVAGGRIMELLGELRRDPQFLRDVLELRSRMADHTWRMLVSPADPALVAEASCAGAEAVRARFERVVAQARELPDAPRRRVEEVLANVVALGHWIEQLQRVVHLPRFEDRARALAEPARKEWEESRTVATRFAVDYAGVYGRLLAALRAEDQGGEARPRLLDDLVLRSLEGSDPDLLGRLRKHLVPPERLGPLDRLILALQYLVEAFPTEQLDPGNQESYLRSLGERLADRQYPPTFHPLIQNITEPIGLEYRPVVYYKSSIDAADYRFIDREVSRISLSQRLGYDAAPVTETVVVRLERPFFFDAVHKHYYAGFAHVARP